MRSHVQIKRDMSSNVQVPLVATAIEELRSSAKLWNRWLPDMIGAYFSDLHLILLELRRMLPLKGRVYMVVGDSRYSGVTIPVSAGLSLIAPKFGYEVIEIEPFLSKRSSPQQGGRKDLGESLIILRAI